MNSKTKKPSMRSYFEDDEDDNDDKSNEYQTSASHPNNTEPADPLDIFMMGVEEQIKKDEENKLKSVFSNDDSAQPEIVSGGYDLYYDDSDEEYDRVNNFDGNDDEDGNPDGSELEYDEDGRLAPKNKNKSKIEPLPTVDHSKINYPALKKCFYEIHSEVKALSESDIKKVRVSLEISTMNSGNDSIPAPVQLFHHINFPSLLLREIKNLRYETPTPIQSQAIPIILSGRDCIGLAKTGSGKTFSYVWPMIVHVINQPQMKAGDGPIGIILAPTRELTQQIYAETKKFTSLYNIRVTAVYGGPGKYEMAKSLKDDTPEIVVATPGRFIELIKMKATNLQRCSMVVLDEADRMFELGFQYQMKSIVNNIRPDRQTVMFSATMKKRIEEFAREILTKPIRISVGQIGLANPDIKQMVPSIFNNENEKYNWVVANLDEYIADGKILLFVSNKLQTESLTTSLNAYFKQRRLDIEVVSLHGDKDQTERSAIIKKFSKTDNNVSVLIATDVASRGLDIKDIRTVINYDVPKNIDTYIHRIGRTSRMNIDGVKPGTAYTLLTQQDASFAVDLVHNLKLSHQTVPNYLIQFAEKDPKWNRVKYGGSSSSGSSGKTSGLGLGNGLIIPMTSAHAAQMSNNSSSSSSIQNNQLSQTTLMKNYIDVNNSSGIVTSHNNNTTKPSSQLTVADTTRVSDNNRNILENAKRKSRFSPAGVNTAPVLSGFVRATTSSSNYSDSKYEVATSLSSSSDELHTSTSISNMNSNIPTKVSSETSSTAVDRNPIINDDPSLRGNNTINTITKPSHLTPIELDISLKDIPVLAGFLKQYGGVIFTSNNGRIKNSSVASITSLNDNNSDVAGSISSNPMTQTTDAVNSSDVTNINITATATTNAKDTSIYVDTSSLMPSVPTTPVDNDGTRYMISTTIPSDGSSTSSTHISSENSSSHTDHGGKQNSDVIFYSFKNLPVLQGFIQYLQAIPTTPMNLGSGFSDTNINVGGMIENTEEGKKKKSRWDQ